MVSTNTRSEIRRVVADSVASAGFFVEFARRVDGEM